MSIQFILFLLVLLVAQYRMMFVHCIVAVGGGEGELGGADGEREAVYRIEMSCSEQGAEVADRKSCILFVYNGLKWDRKL